MKLAAERAKKEAGEGLFFCVQKHLASHLHYDFRLEYKGVLLSWAVPKGPSLDPKTKRLAMHVEDHPIEYGTFEGVIPAGYGAGIVMLWDQGTWTPQADDVDAALKKGDLKFTLDGYKLKGSWVLVRTGGRYPGGGDRSWLLIKHKDDWAGEVDITDVRAAQREERGRLRRHSRRRQSRDLDLESSRARRRDRRDVPEDRRARARDEERQQFCGFCEFCESGRSTSPKVRAEEFESKSSSSRVRVRRVRVEPAEECRSEHRKEKPAAKRRTR